MDVDDTVSENDAKNKGKVIWLGLGIGLIALIIGYMVGASSVSVVSVAVPVVFGLVVTALGFIGGSNTDKRIDELKEIIMKIAQIDIDKARQAISKEVEPLLNKLDSYKKEAAINIENIGKILVVFSLFYVIGLSFGTYARVTNLYITTSARKLPWNIKNHAKPSTAAMAIQWISIQEQLLQLGYSEDQIDEIYAINPESLDDETLINPFPVFPSRTPTPYPLTSTPPKPSITPKTITPKR